MDINSFLGYIFSIVEFLNFWRSKELSFCKQFRAVSYEKQETICVLEKKLVRNVSLTKEVLGIVLFYFHLFPMSYNLKVNCAHV